MSTSTSWTYLWLVCKIDAFQNGKQQQYFHNENISMSGR